MTKLELRDWRDFLSTAIAQWGNSGAVHPLCTDPDLFVFKTIADALLARGRLEAAVEQFIATGQWPPLSSQDTIYMLHRALLARSIVDHYLENESAWASAQQPVGKAAVLRCLLITAWNEGGPAYMKAWAERYLKTDPPPT